MASQRIIFETGCALAGLVGSLCLGTQAIAQARSASAPTVAKREAANELQTKISDKFIVAAVGDIIEPQPILLTDPSFQKLVDNLRKADVGFANMESSLIDFKHFNGPVFGTQAPLALAKTMRDMGITMVNRANNHTFDGGVMGMISTDEALDDVGIVHAGTGRNLQEARAPQFLNTGKGRVGLIGMFSVDDVSNYGPAYSRTEASTRNGNIGGAPGLNPLHLTTIHVVSAEQLKMLKQVASASYKPGEESAKSPSGPERIKFFDEWFEAGSDIGALHYEINPNDEKDILQNVRNGKIYADFMIATIHAHQSTSFQNQGVGGIEHQPADFLIKLAHDAVDNGADMFITHGMHALHGIEIYKGKPIFYGISNFVFQFGIQIGRTTDVLANERGMSSFEAQPSQVSVLAVTQFDHGKLTEIRLYPADLGGAARPISQIGIPMIPNSRVSTQILHNLQEYSQPYGTEITIENGVGVIKVSG